MCHHVGLYLTYMNEMSQLKMEGKLNKEYSGIFPATNNQQHTQNFLLSSSNWRERWTSTSNASKIGWILCGENLGFSKQNIWLNTRSIRRETFLIVTAVVVVMLNFNGWIVESISTVLGSFCTESVNKAYL